MYVRVVDPSHAAGSQGEEGRVSVGRHPLRPCERSFAGEPVKLNRVFMATAGTYDVYIAFKERLSEKAPKNAVPKMGVLKTQVTVPDYYNGELATSTILVADKVEHADCSAPPEEARERPFVFGMQELLPAADMEFKKSEELSSLLPGLQRRPDTGRQAGPVARIRIPSALKAAREKFFNKTNPQR